MKLHEKIKIVRKSKGIAQNFVAKAAGFTIQNYNMKENGKRQIFTDELERIASALEVSPSLFYDENFHVKWNVQKDVI